jgi:hypothetical protein
MFSFILKRLNKISFLKTRLKAISQFGKYSLAKTLFLILSLLTNEVYAACSPYYALATLNEAGKVGFVETKLLWPSIPASEYNSWNLGICKSNGCTTVPLNGSTLYNDVFLVTLTSFIPNNKVFDVILRDGSGNLIDYLSVGGFTPQYDFSCAPYFDWTAALSNSHDYRRNPDGTGDWENAGNGNTGGNTSGTSNDPNSPIISMAEITHNKGDTAVFVATIPTAEAFDISFDYMTINGDAVNGTHYNYTSGTATIFAGSTSTSINVTTIPNSPGGTVTFYLLLDNAVNGTPSNHFPAANLIDAPSLDHIEITHDGNGVTCSSESIIIKACADASCSTVATTDVDVTLSSTGASTSWSQNPVTIPANSTAGIAVTLSNTTIETITLGASSTPSAANALVCDDGSGTSCNLLFSTVGFKFFGTDVSLNDVVDNIGNQIAGKPSNTLPASQTIKLRAVETNQTTGQCDALINNATQSIGFAYQCSDPNSCGISNNGMAINSLQTIDEIAVGYDYQTIAFDATGTAVINLNYFDVGQIRVKATASLSVGSDTINVQGDSNLFISRPFAYDLQVTGNPNATTATDSVFVVAGNSFATTIRSILWEAADDTNNDGIADAAATLSDNAITPNIVNVSGNINLSSVAQIVLDDGALGVSNVNFNSFAAVGNPAQGTAVVSQSWSEVGIMTINLTTTGFMTTAGNVSGSRTNIGRFRPDHFVIGAPNVSLSCGIFSYGGFYDGINPGLDKTGQLFTVTETITAENSLNATTLNYTSASGFAKLVSGNISIQEYNFDTAVNDTGRVNFSSSPLTFVNGVATFTDIASNYQFDAEKAPFNLQLNLTATDSDTVTGTTSSNQFEVRLGRLILQDSFGPEIAPLEMRLNSEYFDGAEWLLNADDYCTTYIETMASFDPASYTDNLAAGETTISVIGSQSFNAGLSSIGNGLWFTAPSPPADNYGSVQVDLDLSGQPWLQYDWDSDNTLDTVNGTLNFGYYRGSDRVIYWQESN